MQARTHARTHTSVPPAGSLAYVSHLPAGSLWPEVLFLFSFLLLSEAEKLPACSLMETFLPVRLSSVCPSQHTSQDAAFFPPKGDACRAVYIRLLKI